MLSCYCKTLSNLTNFLFGWYHKIAIQGALLVESFKINEKAAQNQLDFLNKKPCNGLLIKRLIDALGLYQISLQIQIKLLSMSRSKLASTSSSHTNTAKVYSSAIFPSEATPSSKETLTALKIKSKKMADYFYPNNPESRVLHSSLNGLYEAKDTLKSEKKCEAVMANPFLEAKLKYMLGESTRNTVQKKNIFTEDLQVGFIQNPHRTTGRQKIKEENEERERKISHIINRIRGDRPVSSQC